MIAPRPIALNPRSRDRRGTILVGILVGLMLVASALVAVAISGRREQDLTMRRMESMRAAYAEEAAAQIAVRELINQRDDDGDGIIGAVASGLLTPGMTIGSSKAAASAESELGGWIVRPRGSNGASTKGSEVGLSVTNYVPGVYVEGFSLASAPANVAAVNWAATPTAVAVLPNVDMQLDAKWAGGPSSNFALRFSGIINIPAAGSWTFSTESAGGSVLWINGVKVVDNDGNHEYESRDGTVSLSAGPAFFDLKYFFASGWWSGVSVRWSGPTVASTPVIPAKAFTCSPSRTVPPVAATTSLTLGGAMLNGYLSESGLYGGSNITSAFSVQTNATAANAIRVTGGTLSGNALCGVGGTPSVAISTGAGGSISGTRTAAATSVGMFYLSPPNFGIPSSGALNVSDSETVFIDSDARYDSINAYSPGAKIIVSGHRVVQVHGPVWIGSDATLELDADSSLRLYIFAAADFEVWGAAEVNVYNADPRNLQVYFLQPGGQMTLSNSAIFHGYVFNPGGPLTIYGGSTPAATYHGVYHGTTISTSSTGLFRADASFGSTSASTNLLTRWRQTQ